MSYVEREFRLNLHRPRRLSRRSGAGRGAVAGARRAAPAAQASRASRWIRSMAASRAAVRSAQVVPPVDRRRVFTPTWR